jgi:drug/metabolite transporter (DMT)-like permease
MLSGLSVAIAMLVTIKSRVEKVEQGYAYALAAVVIWALAPVGTRFFVLRADPAIFNIVRYTAAALSLLPGFWHARPWRWPSGDQKRLLWCALLAVPGYSIPVISARALPAGQLGLLIATEPAFIVGGPLTVSGVWMASRLSTQADAG